MICWMYPGQPLKYLPKPPDDSDFSDIAAICLNKAGFDLAECADLPDAMTPSTGMQIYGVAMSLYFTRLNRKSGMHPDIVTQHSMGIYPALAACGVISEEEAIEITARTGNCMATMGRKHEYMLGCVIGLSPSALQQQISESGAYIANFNTSKHFLLSGLKTSMLPLLDAARKAGAFSVSSFDCDAPLHTPLMADISSELRSIFADYSYSNPLTPLVSHRGVLLHNGDQIRGFLHDELLQPVYWEQTVSILKECGVKMFIEVGAGDALKKFNRWIESEQDNQ